VAPVQPLLVSAHEEYGATSGGWHKMIYVTMTAPLATIVPLRSQPPFKNDVTS